MILWAILAYRHTSFVLSVSSAGACGRRKLLLRINCSFFEGPCIYVGVGCPITSIEEHTHKRGSPCVRWAASYAPPARGQQRES